MMHAQSKIRELPVELSSLALDRSPSMEQTDYHPSRIEGARQAAVLFIKRKRILDGRDRTTVVGFDSSASMVSPFGRHPFEAESDVRSIAIGGGTTSRQACGSRWICS